MAQREEFLEIVDLLGLRPQIRGVGVGGSLYVEDVALIAQAVGVSYRQSRTETWKDIITQLGGTPDEESDVSSGGTIEQGGLQKVLDLLLAGTGEAEERPTLAVIGASLEGNGEFSPQHVQDERDYTWRMVCRRWGQPRFRAALLAAYDSRCAVSATTVEAALEAAHIDGYRGPGSNHVQNGLLLRCDLHTLFDLGLIGVDPNTMTVLVADQIHDPQYRQFHGAPLHLPDDDDQRPSTAALQQHRERWVL